MLLSWVIGVGIWGAEARSGWDLHFLYPVKDGLIAAILLPFAVNPKYPGRNVYGTIAVIFAIQALWRLVFTTLEHYQSEPSYALAYWKIAGLNILLILILLRISISALIRIFRIIRGNGVRNYRRKLMARLNASFPDDDDSKDAMTVAFDRAVTKLGQKEKKKQADRT